MVKQKMNSANMNSNNIMISVGCPMIVCCE